MTNSRNHTDDCEVGCCSENDSDCTCGAYQANQMRYRVLEVWGEVPKQIRELVEKDDAYLLYPEYRGVNSSQAFMSHDEIVGGWTMAYAGIRPCACGDPECPVPMPCMCGQPECTSGIGEHRSPHG